MSDGIPEGAAEGSMVTVTFITVGAAVGASVAFAVGVMLGATVTLEGGAGGSVGAVEGKAEEEGASVALISKIVGAKEGDAERTRPS